nr:hypothetical protein [Halomicroarcula sp. XH51]
MTDTLPFDAVRELDVDGTTYKMADLRALEEQGLCDLDTLPVSIRILLDSDCCESFRYQPHDYVRPYR